MVNNLNIIKTFKAFRPGKILPGIMLTTILLLSACDSNRVYDNSTAIAEIGWEQHDIKRYDVQINQTDSRYNMYINIRNNTDYQYSNIYLFVNTIFPDGGTIRDTVECLVADIDGRWLGRGNRKLRDNQYMIRSGFRFPDTGTYHFELQQAMREQTLQGITDVGIRIEHYTN